MLYEMYCFVVWYWFVVKNVLFGDLVWFFVRNVLFSSLVSVCCKECFFVVWYWFVVSGTYFYVVWYGFVVILYEIYCFVVWYVL